MYKDALRGGAPERGAFVFLLLPVWQSVSPGRFLGFDGKENGFPQPLRGFAMTNGVPFGALTDRD